MITGEFIELACKDKSCAPPPVGTGGSNAHGSSTISAREAAASIDGSLDEFMSPKLGMLMATVFDVPTQQGVNVVRAHQTSMRAGFSRLGEQLAGKIDWESDILDPSTLCSTTMLMNGFSKSGKPGWDDGKMMAVSTKMLNAYDDGDYNRMRALFEEATGSTIEAAMVSLINAHWVRNNASYDDTRQMMHVAGTVLGEHMPGEVSSVSPTPSWLSDRAMGEIVKQVYANTQQVLRERGVKEVTLLRGVPTLETKDNVNIPADGVVDVRLRPLSAYTTSSRIAQSFGGRVIETRIPAESIFSLSDSGIGSFGEGEVIVLGGTYRSTVHQGEDPEYLQSLVNA